MIIVCNIWTICLELNWLFYDPRWILQLSEFVWTLRSSAWVVFNNFLLIDATGRSKISSNQKRLFFAVSLYPLFIFREHSRLKSYESRKILYFVIFSISIVFQGGNGIVGQFLKVFNVIRFFLSKFLELINHTILIDVFLISRSQILKHRKIG